MTQVQTNLIRIAARNSELAKIQAKLVGAALKNKFPQINIDFAFRESAGDQDQSTPLWQMGGRGVFTEDFYKDLVEDRCDLVVHSWKDLPVEPREQTTILGVLEREDVRDVLLFPRKHSAALKENGKIEILTSSPRRMHNLGPLLPQLLPTNKGNQVEVHFAPVRGNVPTRIRKAFDAQAASGVIIAKAALDRLSAHSLEFSKLIHECDFMVMPLLLSPPAPAQGCLAVEFLNSKKQIHELVSAIESSDAKNVIKEREFLASYGGGCHQKIGAYSGSRFYGNIFVGRGLSDSGDVIESLELKITNAPPAAKTEEHIFPSVPSENLFFDREPISLSEKDLSGDILVSRSNAWPDSVSSKNVKLIWASGIKTWVSLAKRGLWVSGCLDSLGEQELVNVDFLLGRTPKFKKLTHQRSEGGELNALVTYNIKPKQNLPDLTQKTHFYWMSGTAFKAALDTDPDLCSRGFHSSGPGNTHKYLLEQINDPKRVSVFLNHSQWKDFVLVRQR